MDRLTDGISGIEAEGMSVPDAAQFIGVGTRTMQGLLASGAVPSLRIGRRRIVRRAALMAFLERAERKAARR